MKLKILLYAMTIVLLSLFQPLAIWGQEQTSQAAADSTKSDSLSTASKPQTVSAKREMVDVGEIVLEEIKIEAVVETPSVAIVPKRLNPDFGKMEFIDRSFEKELKAVPKKPMLIGDELNGVNKIKERKVKNLKPKQVKK